MHIQSSNIGMNSKRFYKSRETSMSSLTTWGKSGMINQTGSSFLQTAASGTSDSKEKAGTFSGGNTFHDSMDDIIDRFNQTRRIDTPKISTAQSAIHKLQQHVMDYLLRWLFGEDTSSYDNATEQIFSQEQIQEFGGHYESSYSYSEAEYTSFETQGTAVTADGRELSFQVNVRMSRSFMKYSGASVDFGAPMLTDPLVINLDQNVASVSDQTFQFDIDADGELDTISRLGAGSGFLALDKNGDGVINDGNELFGTASGDGFADLAQYDTDGNGWIDEADDIWDKLVIWCKDENGKDQLIGLGKAGVGAIYLGNKDTEFSLNSAKDNSTNAVIRKTGIFLYENGAAGTIQHLDVAKRFAATS